jgi:hypothetical protein
MLARQNVIYLEPRPPLNTMDEVMRCNKFLGISLKHFYKKMKSRRWKHGATYTFTIQSHICLDLDYVQNILTKNIKYFIDRTVDGKGKEPLQAYLLNVTSPRWRNLSTECVTTLPDIPFEHLQNIRQCLVTFHFLPLFATNLDVFVELGTIKSQYVVTKLTVE